MTKTKARTVVGLGRSSGAPRSITPPPHTLLVASVPSVPRDPPDLQNQARRMRSAALGTERRWRVAPCAAGDRWLLLPGAPGGVRASSGLRAGAQGAG